MPYYLTEDGTAYYLDENGVPYYVAEDGTPYYTDEEGRAYYYDEDGNAVYYEEAVSETDEDSLEEAPPSEAEETSEIHETSEGQISAEAEDATEDDLPLSDDTAGDGTQASDDLTFVAMTEERTDQETDRGTETEIEESGSDGIESFGKMDPAASYVQGIERSSMPKSPVLYIEGAETSGNGKDLLYMPLMFTSLPVFIENFSDYRPCFRRENPPLPPDEVVLKVVSENEDPYF